MEAIARGLYDFPCITYALFLFSLKLTASVERMLILSAGPRCFPVILRGLEQPTQSFTIVYQNLHFPYFMFALSLSFAFS